MGAIFITLSWSSEKLGIPQGASNIEAMLAQISKPFPDPRKLCPDRKGIDAVAQLIEDCTRKDRDLRIGSIDEVLVRLASLVPPGLQDRFDG